MILTPPPAGLPSVPGVSARFNLKGERVEYYVVNRIEVIADVLPLLKFSSPACSSFS